jgi:hypothetical protein
LEISALIPGSPGLEPFVNDELLPDPVAGPVGLGFLLFLQHKASDLLK